MVGESRPRGPRGHSPSWRAAFAFAGVALALCLADDRAGGLGHLPTTSCGWVEKARGAYCTTTTLSIGPGTEGGTLACLSIEQSLELADGSTELLLYLTGCGEMALVGPGKVREMAATVMVDGEAIEGTGFASRVETRTQTTCGQVSLSWQGEVVPNSIGGDRLPRFFPEVVRLNTVAGRDYSPQGRWSHVLLATTGGVMASQA